MNRMNEKGFTLGELLIVVAIIGVLTGVSVPVLTSHLKQQREMVCSAKRMTAMNLLMSEYIVEKELEEGAVNSLMTSSMGAKGNFPKYSGLCPEGGELVVYGVEGKLDDIRVRCTVHGQTALEVLMSGGGVNLSAMAKSDIFKGYFTPSGGGSAISNGMDSTGPNHGDPLKKALAKALDISTEFDFRIYRESTGEYKVYLCEPLNTVKVGDMVTVYAYIMKPKDGGGYTITEAKNNGQQVPVVMKTTEDRDKVQVEHMALDAAKFQW